MTSAVSPPEGSAPPARRRRGGRPRAAPEALRTATIGVRVSPAEYLLLREKSVAMGMAPAQWLREAALARRLPAPPVPAANFERYAELGRLSANLNQLARRANEGRGVVVADELLNRLTAQVKRLRLELIFKDTAPAADGIDRPGDQAPAAAAENQFTKPTP